MTRTNSAALLGLVVLALAGCGGGDDAEEPSAVGPVVEDPGPVHVHGLGINPADGALFIATHTGLFRVAADAEKAVCVGERFQDTMGFTVTGPDRFLGSGHPDGRDKLPPFLGLIRSTDAGRSWQPVSLLGKRDFHALEAAGTRVYGYGSEWETRRQGLLLSEDGGRSWRKAKTPEPFLAIAADPADPGRVVASGARGVYRSDDEGASWRRVYDHGGLVAWSDAGALLLADADGLVWSAEESGNGWERIGEIAGGPAAFESAGDELYAALHDGTIKLSSDGGRSWSVRSRP